LRIRYILSRVFPNWISTSCCCRKFCYRKDILASIISDYKLCCRLTRLESRICWKRPWTPTIYLCQCWLYHINSCVCISIIIKCNSTRLVNRSCYLSDAECTQSEWPGSCWSLHCIAWTRRHVWWVNYSLHHLATIKSHQIRVVFKKVTIIRWCVIDRCTNENRCSHIINDGQWWFVGNGGICQVEISYICL